MKWSDFFTSSVGKKLIMSLSGLFLVAFLVVHVGLNACIWAMDDGVMFNKAAHFMGQNVVPRVLEIGLFAFFLLHIIQGLVLEFQNRAKRKKGYEVKMGSKGSAWYRKSMGLLGTLILLFLIMHIAHFWVPSRITGLEPVYIDGKEYHNLYAEMAAVFNDNLPVVILYVLGCISLAWHLVHGFQSAFRALGVTNKKYLGLINSIGIGFSVIVPLAFAMMPISFYLGWV
ncbi:MAG: succinate dehydrogenase cytochrome b subunit [Chitinophagaceae bacterium]|nr:succinate dehydrogenase cytochrome b subunit [Chitinophagaceae bacterium]